MEIHILIAIPKRSQSFITNCSSFPPKSSAFQIDELDIYLRHEMFYFFVRISCSKQIKRLLEELGPANFLVLLEENKKLWPFGMQLFSPNHMTYEFFCGFLKYFNNRRATYASQDSIFHISREIFFKVSVYFFGTMNILPILARIKGWDIL